MTKLSEIFSNHVSADHRNAVKTKEHNRLTLQYTQNTMFTAHIDQLSDQPLKSQRGVDIMTVNGLINEFIKPHEHSFMLTGPYGSITMTPEGHGNMPNTYHVDCCYKRLGDTNKKEQHADGFRLSTACCLSACIMFGEQKVDGKMIDAINTKLN